MNGVNIIGVGTYFPEKVVNNCNFNYEEMGIGEKWVNSSGLKERRYASHYENLLDLAFHAAERAIANSKVNRKEIDLLIFTSSTINLNEITPVGVTELQVKLAIPNSLCYRLIETCNGAIMTMEMAVNFLQSGKHKNVLIIAAELFSRIVDLSNESTYKIGMSMGDGAGAVMIQKCDQDENGFLGSKLVSNGEFQDRMGLRIDNETNKLRFGFGNLPPVNNGKILLANEALHKIKEITSESLPKIIEEALEENNVKKENIDFYILHQPNRKFIDAWRELAHIPPQKTLDTLDKYGNLSSVSVLANLDTAYQQQLIKKDDVIVISSVGSGFNCGAMIWKWKLDIDKKHDYLLD